MRCNHLFRVFRFQLLNLGENLREGIEQTFSSQISAEIFFAFVDWLSKILECKFAQIFNKF